ncbi:MAG: BatD family protein [Spongiibacteraceae bacterium]
MMSIRFLRPRFLQQTVLVLLGWLLLSIAHAAPKLEARVDRNSVTTGESLTLTLRLNDTGNYTPDYQLLEKDFAVLGENSSSGMSASIGHVESWTEWQVTLTPLRSGKLTIPAFEIAGAKSAPLLIQVKPADTSAGPATSSEGGEPVFMEVIVDNDAVYVQQQLLLTVRIFQAVALDDMNVTEPEFDNATIRKIAQDKFQRDINGVTYQVHQLTYAIFPQQAGELTIPELVFSAAELRRPRAMFDLGGRGRPIRKLSRQIVVKIKPIPAQFTGKTWLPARNLTVQETWGGNPADISVGNSITRSIAIQADGLMGAQLPALELPTLQQARLYADQPALDDQADASGMHGVRKESAALIPAREGSLQLPEVRVVWWDLDSDSEKAATIPAQTLTIKAGVGTPATTAAIATPESQRAIGDTTDHAMPQQRIDNPLRSTSSFAKHESLWVIATALLALGWLTTLVLYWRLRRQLTVPERSIPPAQANTRDPDNLLPHVFDACKQHNAQAANTALGQWIRATFPQTPTAEQWLRQLGDDADAKPLMEAIAKLQRHIYREEKTSWNGNDLAVALSAWKKRKGTQKQRENRLPPLYSAT